MNHYHQDAGLAALAICESLLLTLRGCGILSEAAVEGLLDDAARAHENMIRNPDSPIDHEAVAKLIRSIAAGRNSVRMK